MSLSRVCPLGRESITVGVPAYNARKTLGLAIESLLCQTVKSVVEIIIVDDGSTDTTANIALAYALRFPDRIRLIRVSNKGVAAARNVIVKEARGFYLTWLDADDVYFPTKLEDQYNHIRTIEQFLIGFEAQALVFCNFLIHDEFHSIDRFLDHPIKNVLTGDLRAYLWAMFTQTDNYRKVGAFNEKLHRCEDTDWLLRYLKAGGEIFADGSAAPQMRYHFSNARSGRHVEDAFLFLLDAYAGDVSELGIAEEWVPRRYWEISNFYRHERKWDDMWRCRTLAAKHGFDRYFPRVIAELIKEMNVRDEAMKQALRNEFGAVSAHNR